MNEEPAMLESHKSREPIYNMTFLRVGIIAILLAAIITLIACKQSPDTQGELTVPTSLEEVPRISASNLQQNVGGSTDILIVDTRGINEYSAGHIQGAVSAPLSKIEAGEWQAPEGKQLILYWSWPAEATSARAALSLYNMGYTDIKVLEGGYAAWRNKGYPIITGDKPRWYRVWSIALILKRMERVTKISLERVSYTESANK